VSNTSSIRRRRSFEEGYHDGVRAGDDGRTAARMGALFRAGGGEAGNG
jgi:hypothetical protein